MQVQQATFAAVPDPNATTDVAALASLAGLQPQLIWVFGSSAVLGDPALLPALQAAFPASDLVGCSTAGEISGAGVSDRGLVLTAVRFAQPDFRVAVTDLGAMDDSAAAGGRLARQLDAPGLHDVVVYGQGVEINGSALIHGFEAVLPAGVTLAGGLAADGAAFKTTWTVSRHAISPRQIVAIGFYNPRTRLHHGTFHGWKPFGPARRVTRAAGNILFALDGQPALDVYKRYLGDYAKGLPASGLLFPFEMLSEDQSAVGLIRTILGIDEARGALILAGDVVENGYLRLMHASTESLVEGAEVAAEKALGKLSALEESLALLVSCVGRKLVMGARVDEEVEAVAEVFGKHATVTGFYSYGEISPLLSGTECKLHNQTMTITHITERID
jgi:hypothetical protein